MATQKQITDITQRLSGERTRRVWDYWHAKAGDEIAPTRDQFSLMDVYQDAPIILLLDVLPTPELTDYRYRFVGTTIVQNRWKLPQPDHTGLTYYEARHQYNFKAVKEAYDLCVDTKSALVMQRNFDALDASGTHERLILPLLSTTDDTVEQLIVVVERLKEVKKSAPIDPPMF